MKEKSPTLKEWRNQLKSCRPVNWHLVGWALVEPSVCDKIHSGQYINLFRKG